MVITFGYHHLLYMNFTNDRIWVTLIIENSMIGCECNNNSFYMGGISMQYKNMFTPITINGCTIPNRFTVTAMVSSTCTEEGYATERFLKYLEAKAKGGYGLIITEDYIVNRHAGGYKYVAGLYKDDMIEGHKKVTDAVHKYGAKIFAQIYHAGRQASAMVNGGVQPVACSPMSCPWNRDMARELTIPEIKEIVKDFGITAGNAKKAGFDGVEIHAGNGYLIAGFLSFYENKRTDEYGGCFKNRMRILDEIYAECRAAVGPDFPLTIRFSAEEHTLTGRNIAEGRMVAKHIEELGFDMINCSNGVYGSFNPGQVSSYHQPHAWTINNAKEFKRVTNLPIIGVNSVDDTMMAESLVEDGFCDLVGMSRCSLADPETPNKAKEGREEEIRPCIRCMQGCVTSTYMQIPLRCCVNPEVAREYEFTYDAPEQLKKVLIIGGGPAGLQAAIAAKRRGHDVTLWEKTGELGGQFIAAAYPPGKGDHITYVCYMVNEVKKLGVNVELNKTATPDEIIGFGADKVIIATGGVPRKPEIPGIDLPIVHYPEDILRGREQVEGRIVVVGAGESGVETAMYLADAERGKIIVTAKRDLICRHADGTVRNGNMIFFRERGIEVIYESVVDEIYNDAVVVRTKNGTQVIPCDAVIMAMGYVANKPYEGLLDELGDKVVYAGDANGTSNAMDAGKEGFEAGYYA